MLALTPMPLQTAGERALFAELARWDTGGAVRGAVVASIPVVDGPMERRLADAVLFVPEGLAVVRIVEVVRQRGVVTALPEGSWTIGPGAGPGEVLQLAGGGSTPLDGLMRAGMDAAVRLRRAGLEPGRIARLTVLVGDLTGLVPTDGDLGEGDQVAILEPRSLLLGIARAGRYAGIDNPRLWTTADVRAALEALGLAGRVPSVQELNGEGFPYSPYVLRTPELLAPAAMAASPASFAGAGVGAPVAAPPAASAVPVASAVPAAAPLVDPAAAAAVAAAAIRADEAARAPAPASAPVPARQPLAPQPPVSRAAADTLVGPTPGVSAEDNGAGGEETGGLGDLFAGEEPEDPTSGPPRAAALIPPPSARPPALPDGVPLVGPRRRPRSARRTATLVAAVLAPVVVLGVGGALLFGGEDADRPDAGAATVDAGRTTEATDAATGPQPGDVEVVDGLTFTAEKVQVEDTCVGNAYGAVADFFAASDCTGLARALYSTDVDGRPAVVSVSVVDMGSTDGARALRALADRNGSGNVSDLLREGVRYPGGPERLSGAEYASAVSGTRVTIVETAWAAPGSGGSAADLDVVAGTSLVLPMPDPATA